MGDFVAFDRANPDFKIDIYKYQEFFGQEIIDKLNNGWNILQNFMFIGSPGDYFPHQLSDLECVRLII